MTNLARSPIPAALALALAGCGPPSGPNAPATAEGPAVEAIARDWIYGGKESSRATVTLGYKGGRPLVSTSQAQAQGPYEEAWRFYARKCGVDMSRGGKYAAGGVIHNFMDAGDDQDGEYSACDVDDEPIPGRHTAAFCRRTKGHVVSVTLLERPDQTLAISVTVVPR